MKKIQQEMSFDSLTPILVYRALGGIGSCILESAYEKGEGKVSMIGINPIGTFKAKGKEIEIELHGEKTKHVGDPYEALKQFSKDRKTFGFISYGAIRFKESIPQLAYCGRGYIRQEATIQKGSNHATIGDGFKYLQFV